MSERSWSSAKPSEDMFGPENVQALRVLTGTKPERLYERLCTQMSAADMLERVRKGAKFGLIASEDVKRALCPLLAEILANAVEKKNESKVTMGRRGSSAQRGRRRRSRRRPSRSRTRSRRTRSKSHRQSTRTSRRRKSGRRYK